MMLLCESLYMKFTAEKMLKRAFLSTITMFFAANICCQMCFAQMAHKDSLTSADNLIKEAVSQKKVNKTNWYPAYHLAPEAYSMGHPNAFVEFNNEYKLFYMQKLPDALGGKAVWSQVTGTNLVNWKHTKTALAPSENYDKDGVFAGSAIVEDGLLHLMFTGLSQNVQNDKTVNQETQNLAISKDGLNFGKSANNPVIKMAPHFSYLEFSSKIFRDPYVWKKEDRYYALVGALYEKTQDGAVLLFKSKDLRNWVCINITALGQKQEMGQIWEIPSLVHIGNDDVLSISIQGIKPQEKMFLNKLQSGAFLGKLDYNTGKFSQRGAFRLYDYGFDFYAPQFVKTKDGRDVFIAWLGMDGTPLPEHSEGWSSMMTLPRELNLINGKLFTPPAKEVEVLRSEKTVISPQSINGEKEFLNVKGNVYEIDADFDLAQAKTLFLKLRTSTTQETVLSYDKTTQTLKLNRDKSGKDLNGEREVKLPLNNNVLKLRIFVDKSSIEVFANDGQVVMSSRIYPDKNSIGVKLVSDGPTALNKFDFYKLKTLNY